MTENWIIHDVVEDYIGQEVSTTIFVVERTHFSNNRIRAAITSITSFLLEERAKGFVTIINEWCKEKKVGGVPVALPPEWSQGGAPTLAGYPVYVSSGSISASPLVSGVIQSGMLAGSPIHLTSENPYYAPIADPRDALTCPYDPDFKWFAGSNIYYAYKPLKLTF